MTSFAQVLLRSAQPGRETTASCQTLEQWWALHCKVISMVTTSGQQALVAGSRCDRLGYAFASGYQLALTRLFGEARNDEKLPAALCASERGGAHPRAIHTALTQHQGGWLIDGEKSFVTLGHFARRLLVVASTGKGSDGRNQLRVADLRARAGLALHDRPATPFVPEVPHARLALNRALVAPEELLPGDGYARYVKPFRTVEDCHVHAALLGYLLRVALRHRWEAQSETLLAMGLTMAELCAADSHCPAAQLALEGGIATLHQQLPELELRWAQSDDPDYQLWQRDKPLLAIAASAREQRRVTAWRSVVVID